MKKQQNKKAEPGKILLTVVFAAVVLAISHGNGTGDDEILQNIAPLITVIMAGLFALLPALTVIIVIRKLRKESKTNDPIRYDAAADAREKKDQVFAEPDAYCVVCEQTGDDHFARDKVSRIKQLDEWLKNGLIDAKEYRELKERYLHNR